jgi:SET domain
MVNHSCKPNVVIVFPGDGRKSEEPLMKIVALKDIKPKEEVFGIFAFNERQSMTFQDFGFLHRYNATSGIETESTAGDI